MEKEIHFGNRRLVGQQNAREQISRIIASKRTGHAYLFTGPKGSGKMAFALAFAEVINGIDHFTDLKGSAFSKKSSWFNHPDIHVFFPIPKNTSQSEIQARIGLLHKDPYEIIVFSLRPVTTEPGSSKTSRPSILSTITTRKFVRQLFTNRTKAEKQSSSCRISRQCEKRL